MLKKIIALNGYTEGKNEFVKCVIARTDLFTRHRNPYDKLSKIADELGWDRNKNMNYWKFLEKQMYLANEHFDFLDRFLDGNIRSFLSHHHHNLLIFHGLEKDRVENLKQSYDNIVSIHIHKMGGDESLEGYDIILTYPDGKFFTEKVNEMLDDLYKENEEYE